MELDFSIFELSQAGATRGGFFRERHPKTMAYTSKYRSRYANIDLQATKEKLIETMKVFQTIGTTNKKILFVGTMPLIRSVVKKHIEPTSHYYINYRWLGGLLTNFEVLSKRIERLQKIRAQEENGIWKTWSKREQMMFMKKKSRLERSLCGIIDMKKLPDYLVLIGPRGDKTALSEATKLGIPVFGITRPNINPDLFEKYIPINDQSEISVSIVLKNLCHALIGDSKKPTSFVRENKTESAKDIFSFKTPTETNLTKSNLKKETKQK